MLRPTMIGELPISSKEITRRHGMMSIKHKIWDYKFTRDFSRLFVEPQEDKNNLYPYWGLISYICYVSKALTPLQTVRYMKHTCTLAKFHILARYMYWELRQIGTNFRAYHNFKRNSDTLNVSAFALCFAFLANLISIKTPIPFYPPIRFADF
jgi:hypothetical protein